MSTDLLPVFTHARIPWNKGRIIGQPPALVYFNATQTDQQVQAVA